VPPGYTGDLPDSGYTMVRLRTTRAVMRGREFLEDNNLKRPVDLIKSTLKIYPYQSGGFGTSIATGTRSTSSAEPRGTLGAGGAAERVDALSQCR
jgi:hypothetical protein